MMKWDVNLIEEMGLTSGGLCAGTLGQLGLKISLVGRQGGVAGLERWGLSEFI